MAHDIAEALPRTAASLRRLREAWVDLQRARAEARYSKAILHAMRVIPKHASRADRCAALDALLLASRVMREH